MNRPQRTQRSKRSFLASGRGIVQRHGLKRAQKNDGGANQRAPQPSGASASVAAAGGRSNGQHDKREVASAALKNGDSLPKGTEDTASGVSVDDSVKEDAVSEGANGVDGGGVGGNSPSVQAAPASPGKPVTVRADAIAASDKGEGPKAVGGKESGDVLSLPVVHGMREDGDGRMLALGSLGELAAAMRLVGSQLNRMEKAIRSVQTTAEERWKTQSERLDAFEAFMQRAVEQKREQAHCRKCRSRYRTGWRRTGGLCCRAGNGTRWTDRRGARWRRYNG